MKTSVSSQTTLIHLAPALIASRSWYIIITSASSCVVLKSSRSIDIPMCTSVVISFPVMISLCWYPGFLNSSISLLSIIPISCNFVDEDPRATVCGGSGIAEESWCSIVISDRDFRVFPFILSSWYRSKIRYKILTRASSLLPHGCLLFHLLANGWPRTKHLHQLVQRTLQARNLNLQFFFQIRFRICRSHISTILKQRYWDWR